jgi:hypothetical protein
MMKILAQLDAAGAADDATLRMLFGNEQHVAGMLEELRDMRGAPSGSPAAAMSQSLFQDAGRRREAQCSVCGKLRSHTSASFKKCSGCRGPELYCSDSDCFARGWIRHKPICFERRGAVVAPEDIAARDAVLEEERSAWLREAEALASKVDLTPDSNQRALLFKCSRSSITAQYNVVSQELAAFRPSFAHTSDDDHAIMLAHLPPSGLDSVLEPVLRVRRPRPSSYPLQFAVPYWNPVLFLKFLALPAHSRAASRIRRLPTPFGAAASCWRVRANARPILDGKAPRPRS